ncbi:MAG: hypothetical protein QOD97_26 [Mycobacterium sp.]|jgi:hypothetical protein|nr:hypothetical protein [Mycobacterium sp.]
MVCNILCMNLGSTGREDPTNTRAVQYSMQTDISVQQNQQLSVTKIAIMQQGIWRIQEAIVSTLGLTADHPEALIPHILSSAIPHNDLR